MLCSVYTTIAGEYCDPGFCTPIGLLPREPSLSTREIPLRQGLLGVGTQYRTGNEL